jgi:hypothetical protein
MTETSELTKSGKYSWVKFLMKRSYKDFLENDGCEKNTFLKDLSKLLSYPESEFSVIDIRKGCVIMEATLPRVGVLRLMSLWDLTSCPRKDDSKESEEEAEFRIFAKRHTIRSILNTYANKRVELLMPQKQPDSETSTAVIFIHGWRIEGFLYKGGNHPFEILDRPNDTFGKLPEFILKAFNASTAEYQYPTGIIVPQPSFYDIAKSFNNFLQEYFVNGYTEVCLVGHSAGGIVVRKCMTHSVFKEDRDKYVRQITFIASPYTGVNALKALCWFFPNDQVEQLKRDSNFLSELNDNWQRWKRSWIHSQYVRCIYSPEDTIVSKADATIDDPEAIPILGLDHVKIKDAVSPGSEVVKTMFSFLQDAGFRKLNSLP